MGQAFRNGPGRTLMGPPAANRCESGPSLPGASAPSLHFSSREKGHRAPHHLGPHRCLVPEWRLSDPDPLSQVSFCILAGDGGTDTVWLNVFLSSLSVWVSVCMTWNKLPTASLSCVPAVPQPRTQPPARLCAPPLRCPFAALGPSPLSWGTATLASLVTWQALSGEERRNDPWSPPHPDHISWRLPQKAQYSPRWGAGRALDQSKG